MIRRNLASLAFLAIQFNETSELAIPFACYSSMFRILHLASSSLFYYHVFVVLSVS